MKKNTKIAALLLACTMFTIASPAGISTVQASADTTAVSQNARHSIISWRFKTVDGVVYKRLYDYSSDTWIGDWIKVS